MLHKALQAAALQDRVARNVVDFTLAPKKTRAPSRVAFSAAQAVAFLKVIRGHPLEGVFLFGMALGLRMGEATGVLWSDLDIPNRVFYLRHQVAPDVQAEGGACLCGTRCGRAAVLEGLKSTSSTRGLELPDVLVPALRRQAQRIEHQRALRASRGREWLSTTWCSPAPPADPCSRHGSGPGWIRSLEPRGFRRAGSTTCATPGAR
jgi:integrase